MRAGYPSSQHSCFGKGELWTLHSEWRHLLSHPGQVTRPASLVSRQVASLPESKAVRGLRAWGSELDVHQACPLHLPQVRKLSGAWTARVHCFLRT